MEPVERPRYSCMLGGALATISALPGVVPLIHGAQGCGGGLFNAFSLGGHLGAGYCGGTGIPSSNIGEKEVIFGGAKRLKTQIDSTLEVMDGELFVVLTACMTDIIGEDVEAVIKEVDNPENKPIIYVDTGGFQGKAYDGYDAIFSGLFKSYIPKGEKQENLVNIFGQVPGYDPYFRGNLEELKRLLESIGLEVNTFLTPDQSHENILNAGKAALNIVVSPIYGEKIALTAKETHDIDYIKTNLPIGAKASAAFLKQIAAKLNIDNQIVDEVIAREKKIYYGYFDRITDFIADTDIQSYGVVIGNSTDAFSYADYLENEIGFIPKYIFITDQLSDDNIEILKNKFKEYNFGDRPELNFIQDTTAIRRYVEKQYEKSNQNNDDFPEYTEDLSPLIVLGSSIDYKLAQKFQGVLVPVSYPVFDVILNRGFVGFKGGNALLEYIINLQLRKEAKQVV